MSAVDDERGHVGAATSTPVLELREVRRWFGGIRAVDGVSLAIPEGSVIALIGPNGAGKSTLFGLLMGELAPTAGQILLDGRPMAGLSPERRTRLGIGRTFQAPRLFAGLTVRENLHVALLAGSTRVAAAGLDGRMRRVRSPPGHRVHPLTGHLTRWLTGHLTRWLTGHLTRWLTARRTRALRIAQVEEALAEMRLLGDADRAAGSLSQGARKRLELAMVLALAPRILLLDEPTAGMGVHERATIMQLIDAAVSRRRLTMVFTEHDMETVFARAQRIVVMDRGVVLADGAPQAVREDPRVQEVYLGRHASAAGGLRASRDDEHKDHGRQASEGHAR